MKYNLACTSISAIFAEIWIYRTSGERQSGAKYKRKKIKGG